jgi:hypothetical protein
MSKWLFSLLFILLVIIHTLDMILTWKYVGEEWWSETFLPMRICIKELGIHNALWVSRIIMYSYFWYAVNSWQSKSVQVSLLIFTLLYWTAMIPWLYTLGYVNWP